MGVHLSTLCLILETRQWFFKTLRLSNETKKYILKKNQLNIFFSCITINKVIISHISPQCWDCTVTPWVEIGKISETILCFPKLFLPPSCCAFCLTHSISLPFRPRRVCCWPSCLNLGGRTHRAASVYSTATLVQNTLPWKYSQSVHSKTLKKLDSCKTSSSTKVQEESQNCWGSSFV